MYRVLSRRPLSLVAVAALAVPLSACGDSSASTTEAEGSATHVTIALDYIANNAGYAGIYAAEAKGYFKAAHLDVTVIPYTQTTPDVLVNAGKADFGTMDQPTLMMDRAAGQKPTSVMAIMQHDANRIALADKDASITSPAQLSGKTFGAFGVPMEKVYNDQTIKSAGGTPKYKDVTLGVSVFDALRSGQVDWTIPYETDDVQWAKRAGHPFKVFNPLDYGVPDSYTKLVFASEDFLSKNPDITRSFVGALVKGYTWAARNPEQAVKAQAKQVKGSFVIGDQTATAKDLAANYWLDSKGVVGPETDTYWKQYATFLTDAGLLKDSAGKTLTTPPDTSQWFTNSFLPAGQ